MHPQYYAATKKEQYVLGAHDVGAENSFVEVNSLECTTNMFHILLGEEKGGILLN